MNAGKIQENTGKYGIAERDLLMKNKTYDSCLIWSIKSFWILFFCFFLHEYLVF